MKAVARRKSECELVDYRRIGSGTSEFIVIDAADLFADGDESGTSLVDRVGQLMRCSGLGGPTCQENKVALVWRGRNFWQFTFQFLQYVPATGTVRTDMECSNCASAVSSFVSAGMPELDRGSVLRTVNLATGQRIEARPCFGPGAALGPSAWDVRFLLEGSADEALRGALGEWRVRIGERRVEVHPVMLGNLFVFARIDPGEVDPETIDAVAAVGLGAARDAGLELPRDYEPKVIPYRVLADRHVHAASFFHGERHKSLPGSAAMALASFLELRHERACAGATGVYRLRHTAGEVSVTLGFEQGPRNRRIAWTEFRTPVRFIDAGCTSLMKESPSASLRLVSLRSVLTEPAHA